MSSKAPATFLVIAALIAVQILFGLNYVISKVVVEAFPPLVWASIRIIISATLLFGFAFAFRGKHRPKGTWKTFYKPLIALAFLGTILNQGCFLVGLSYTTPTNSAILNTLIPVFAILIVTIRGQEPASATRLLGFLCAFSGVLILRKIEDFTISNETAFGDILMILNCLFFGLFLSYGKSFLEKHDRLWTTAWLFAYGSVGLSIAALPDYSTFGIPAMTPELWGAAVFAVVGGTLLTYFLNNWALAYAKASNVAIFVYIQPVITMTLAWHWYGTIPTVREVISSMIVFTGVLLVVNGGRNKSDGSGTLKRAEQEAPAS